MDTEKALLIAGGLGVLAIGAYFVYSATSSPTNQTGSACAGDWTDYVNPACWITGAQANFSNEVNTGTNEINTVLIVVALLVVLVVGLLAFGPQGGSLLATARTFV